MLRLALGISDFLQLRRSGWHYVDKSGLIARFLRSPNQTVLLPRPRRFGKTINLSALRYFLERSEEPREDLYADLAVWAAGDDVRSHFQRHPVICLTFKDVKHATWEESLANLRGLVADEVARLSPVLEAVLSDRERALRDTLLSGRADAVELERTLGLLTAWLARATGEGAVILIDEYDTPIHAGHANGYYDPIVSFFRNFLSAGLKDNPHLYRGALTGILRVARESLFSGLNNIGVSTLLSPDYAEDFGFSEAEVAALASATGASHLLDEIRAWYDGYVFGGLAVYNPWSILNFLASSDRAFRPWWVQTSADDVLRELLVERGLGLHDDLAALLGGEELLHPVEEDIVLRDVRRNPDALWSFLAFCGYLKVRDPHPEGTRQFARLSIPNREVAGIYDKVFRQWLESGVGGPKAADLLLRAILEGDADTFERLLETLIVEALSSHDVAVRTPEAVYQAFIVGLLVRSAESFEVRSNRESGLGRYDLSVLPRSGRGPGAVIELKVLDKRRGETVDQALDAAMTQIEDRRYRAELEARGVGPIHAYGAVFDGKRVWVRRG